MELTKEIIQRCHDLNYNDLSDDIIDRTKYLLLDYIGVAARGSLSDSSIPLLRLVQDLDKTAEGAVVIGTNIRVSPPLAALANGTAAHSLELDDVVNEASLHPAVAIMPAAMAVTKLPSNWELRSIRRLITPGAFTPPAPAAPWEPQLRQPKFSG